MATGYSGVTYILGEQFVAAAHTGTDGRTVDPLKPSGQNLYRQYANKKGKVVLDSRWVHECIKAGELQAFAHGWAGCRVTGAEVYVSLPCMHTLFDKPSDRRRRR